MSQATDQYKAAVLRLDEARERIKALEAENERLRESIAQPAGEAEPVEYQFQARDGSWHGFIDERHRLNTIEDGTWPIRALYTAPQKAQPLTSGDIWHLALSKCGELHGDCLTMHIEQVLDLVRAVEAHHNIKKGGTE